MLASFGHLASATELWRGIVDEKFGDDGQKRRRLPSPHTDEAVKDPIQKSGIAPVGVQRYQRFGLRHMDRHARHTEQAEWMATRQGTAYRVPECRIGRTVPGALVHPPLVTSDLFDPARSSFVTHIADATHGQ